MKKFLFIFLTIPFAFFVQAVFSATFTHNNYYFRSPTVDVMSQTIPDLQSSTADYNSNLKNELEKIQRDTANSFIFQSDAYEPQNRLETLPSNSNENFPFTPAKITPQSGLKNNQITPVPKTPTKNFTKEQTQPKWWRQENSFEGWGFD